MMTGIYHLAIDGKPVGMDVEHAHKHRQLHATAVEVLVLECFLKSHHGAVGCRNNGILSVTGEKTTGRTEKINHQKVKNRTYHGTGYSPAYRTPPNPQGYVDKQ
jgi:hypothetical protein